MLIPVFIGLAIILLAPALEDFAAIAVPLVAIFGPVIWVGVNYSWLPETWWPIEPAFFSTAVGITVIWWPLLAIGSIVSLAIGAFD